MPDWILHISCTVMLYIKRMACQCCIYFSHLCLMLHILFF